MVLNPPDDTRLTRQPPTKAALCDDLGSAQFAAEMDDKQ
jgi:hypothetical protein